MAGSGKVMEAKEEYFGFLDDEEDQGIYSTHVKDLILEKKRRLIVDINDIRRKLPKRAMALQRNADDEILALNSALSDYISSHFSDGDGSSMSYCVGFDGCFGDRHVTPRMITSLFIGSLLCVDGIVTRITSVRPHAHSSVHYCIATGKVTERKYSNSIASSFASNGNVYPNKDEDGNLLETEFGLSCYKDFQIISLQEKPEISPPGQLPRSIDIICEEDLADRCKPGDRVKVIASYRCLPFSSTCFTTGTLKVSLLANNITLQKQERDTEISKEELTSCKILARDPNVFQILSSSLAPSIHGHDFVKKAILCLLLGGTEKKLMNGTRLRGDINILLIGDPSVAKSQLLRYVMLIAPRVISATGRGSSGVGLTAAVSHDQENGERKLEAGAMVLADRGIVCIDEFDKMSDIDRTAIHEVMEQGRVTISKAGIHARLNARCSVLAAANPVYGKYDQEKTPMQNIGLQDSLLTRFDLLFVMLDKINKGSDKTIADHVVQIHRFRDHLEHAGEVASARTELHDMFQVNNSSIYEKYGSYTGINQSPHLEKILSVDFMRKYIHIARCLNPKLTELACDVICDEYSRLRTQGSLEAGVVRTQPVTVRTLETLIRLATAHAKARLSNVITPEDAKLAIKLIRFTTLQCVFEKDKRKRTEDNIYTDCTSEKLNFNLKRHKTYAPENSHINRASKACGMKHDGIDSAFPRKDGNISLSRLDIFKVCLFRCFRDNRDQSMSQMKLIASINASIQEKFSEQEINAAFLIMTKENQIMLADGVVFLI